MVTLLRLYGPVWSRCIALHVSQVKPCILGMNFIQSCPETIKFSEGLEKACQTSTSFFRNKATMARRTLDQSTTFTDKLAAIVEQIACTNVRELTTTPLIAHTIQLIQGSQNGIKQRMTRIPLTLRDEFKNCLSDMESAGIIHKSS
jgi:hypothetical protein